MLFLALVAMYFCEKKAIYFCVPDNPLVRAAYLVLIGSFSSDYEYDYEYEIRHSRALFACAISQNS